MKDFIIAVGAPKSGINAVSWLLKQSGYTVGLRDDSDDLTIHGVYNQIHLQDKLIYSKIAPFIKRSTHIVTSVDDVEEGFYKELSSLITLINHKYSQFLINDLFILHVLPLIWNQVKDYAKLIVVNRDLESILPLLKKTEGFSDEYALLSNTINDTKNLFQQDNRPVLEVNYNDFANDQLSIDICDFCNVTLAGDIKNLGWLDTIIESFNQ